MCAIVCPCKPDCPNRGYLCHTQCGKYKIYKAMRDKEYERKQKERDEAQKMISYYQEKNEKKRRRYG